MSGSQVKDILHVDQIKDILQLAKNTRKPVILSGGPGIGKTQVVEDWAKEQAIPWYTLPLSTVDSVDLRGVLLPTEDGADWSAPKAIRKLGETAGILFFDEMSQCPQGVLAGALRVLSERQVGEVTLHPDTIVVGGINPPDAGGAFELPKLIVNRVFIFTVEPDLPGFEKYIREKYSDMIETASVVLGFLGGNPSALYRDPKEEGTPFPTPRSWEGVLKAMLSGCSPEIIDAAIVGGIGSGTAAEFMQFRRVLDLPELSTVLSGQWTPTAERLDAAFVVASMLVAEGLRKGARTLPKIWEAVDRFVEIPGLADVFLGVARELGHSGKQVPENIMKRAAAMIY